MRILILNYEFPPLGGGAGNATYYLLKEFSKKVNLKIDLVTSSTGKYKEKVFSKNIKIYYIDIGKKGNLHYQSNKDLLKYSIKAYSFSKKLVRKNDYNLVHAFFGIPCGYIAMKLGLPYIASLRGSDVPFYNPRFYLLDKLFFRRLSKKIWKKAFKVITLSNDLRNLAYKTTNDVNIDVIYNGIDLKDFYPNNKIKSKEKTFNILFVGRLIERKGVIYLLKTFQKFNKLNKWSKLIIVGDGPLKKDLQRYCHSYKIEPHVNFLGIMPHNKLIYIYQKSHIFVLSSLNEALGNVTQEAMACGLPIVTTKTGAAELIDKTNGFVVKKENPGQIYKALVKLYYDTNLLKSMSDSSYQKAKLMSWDKCASQYYKIYENI